MKIICDTNLLVRIIVEDDPLQANEAVDFLDAADIIIIPIVVACELVWVLRSRNWGTADVARIVRGLISDPRVIVDHELIDRGLTMLDAGGDFADGVIAADGQRREDATFATFDRKAARLLQAQGIPVTLLG